MGNAQVNPPTLMGWPFRPYKFNVHDKKWESVQQHQQHEQLPQQLKLLTYNVLFDNYNLENRMQAIGEIITSEDPDIIALQEISHKICNILFGLHWVHKYYVSDPYGEEFGKSTDKFKYGNVLISKFNFHELYLRDFESARSRKVFNWFLF